MITIHIIPRKISIVFNLRFNDSYFFLAFGLISSISTNFLGIPVFFSNSSSYSTKIIKVLHALISLLLIRLFLFSSKREALRESFLLLILSLFGISFREGFSSKYFLFDFFKLNLNILLPPY